MFLNCFRNFWRKNRVDFIDSFFQPKNHVLKNEFFLRTFGVDPFCFIQQAVPQEKLARIFLRIFEWSKVLIFSAIRTDYFAIFFCFFCLHFLNCRDKLNAFHHRTSNWPVNLRNSHVSDAFLVSKIGFDFVLKLIDSSFLRP